MPAPLTVEFTERLTGSLAPVHGGTTRYGVELTDLAIQVAVRARTPDGGLPGLITGGRLAIPALHPAPLPVRGGSVELLASTPPSGTMRYRVEAGPYLLQGVKHLAARRSLGPRTIWRDTTTLATGIYQLPAERLILSGDLVLGVRDFARQLRSLRAGPSSDPEDGAAAVLAFLGTFAAKTTHLYLRRCFGVSVY